MADGRWWVALVTFERRGEDPDTLPDWAHGACGWMMALLPDEESARRLLVRDVQYHGLSVLEVDNEREVFGDDDIEGIDDHLAMNVRELEPGKQTVWGTIHGIQGRRPSLRRMSATLNGRSLTPTFYHSDWEQARPDGPLREWMT